ncbi:3-phosphoshikimate 1-carboxyvinyltransferase [Culicoidibacter larvae]|uniref:3-phosphoshikimate 1-carboxyvinyltransferase n=1 Tax=Culicoidibacter larvae TaxID=2579976 RepID=A0A5R8QEZ1_9FIRM|nr:3-phosphoshikimate 1-carboxyvinyltransferase [Culicoidibacter larvae]TLG76601.1 3-phosphoshikimate 1-carboxyvinyltransferase [Culicoidibacter larvae]
MIRITDLPSDKSISHRALIFASLLPGRRVLHGSHFGEDVLSTIRCFKAFGVAITVHDTEIIVESRGWQQFVEPREALDAGNSGTTARLLMGICAALPFKVTISGDASLSKRPMRRVAEPLILMGADITLSNDGCLPAVILGQKLHSIDYKLPVASAQLKSALLLAAFVGGVSIIVHEPARTRNHTELFLSTVGAEIEQVGITTWFNPQAEYQFANEYSIPGDASSAAYWVVWASLADGVILELDNVGLNPSRLSYVQVLKEMGADIVTASKNSANKTERIGSIMVRSSKLHGITVSAESIADIIDEIPILALAAGFADGETCFNAVEELRVKESNRLEAITELLKTIGVTNNIDGNDLHITGAKVWHGGIIHTYHDHRIAMCAEIAAILIDADFDIDDVNCIAVSYPNFFEHLRQINEGSRVIK